MGMKISKYLRKKMVEEMRYALEKMKEENDERKKLYYYSGIYGVIPRVFNFEYDPQLVFTYQVISNTYNNFNTRLSLVAQGDTTTSLVDNVFDKLYTYTSQLVDKIEQEEDNVYGLLQKIAVLGFTATGNGYYLYKKGIIQI